ncbi:hypothetical protein BJY04DRAFT_138619 [Aspergillus karnatakaensis]|uniref:uncharacterized protein n=1 Tax=Aspergillus karnatakaensis TaxID=1810916 RepID=UPI003CCDBBCC
MAARPSHFLQQLALQMQVVAGLQWLCEFQVLACIPLDGTATFDEVAGISNVAVGQLQRVVRLMATADFLAEPTSGQIAHTPLSASFVTEPDLLDAGLFLAQTAGPAALRMSMSQSITEPTLHDRRWPSVGVEAQPKAQRQLAAYLRYAILDEASAIDDVLQKIEWGNLGATTVVDVHPPSATTVATLAALAPGLQFVVQLVSGQEDHSWIISSLPSSISGQISVQSRASSAVQTFAGPAVYILRIPSPSAIRPWASIRNQTVLEVQAHLPALRMQSSSQLIVASPVLPTAGGIDPEVEANMRLHDLTLLQLSDEHQPNTAEILELITGVTDGTGRLALVREIQTPTSAAIALEMRYQLLDLQMR